MRDADFAETLDRLLGDVVVTIADYPVLADIAWSLAVKQVSARRAFALYERNWRFVDERSLTPTERSLIQKLAARYGAGIIHA